MRQAFRSLEAAQDEGPHRLIKHPDMRVFWRALFRGQLQVRAEHPRVYHSA